MPISKIKQNNIQKSGFTLVELVVVLAGLTALTAITVPGILNQIKLSKIESTKALMNAYAAECLGKYRTSTNPSQDYVDKVEPSFDSDQLDNLGYKMDGGNKTCSSFAIKPLDDNEGFSYGMKFEVIGGNIVKTGSPYGSPPPEAALRSCKNWAGKNCGMTDAQKARLAEERALQKRKDSCDSNYYDWSLKAKLANSDLPGSGRSWSSKDKDCNIKWWAYGGRIGPNKDWYDAEVEKAIGEKCNKWRLDRINEANLTDEQTYPNGETESNCKGKKYWFTLDQSFTAKSAWEEQVLKDAKSLCDADIIRYTKKEYTGDIVVKPKIGPLPCNTKKWFCKGFIENDKASWEDGTCGQEKKAKEEAEKARQAAEQAKKDADKKIKLPDQDIPKVVPGKTPGKTIKCKAPMPKECNSPKWRRLIPACKCWFPNG